MLRNAIKGLVEALRWRWLNIEQGFKLIGISNVTIRTIITALCFVVITVIVDILFEGFVVLALFFSKRLRQWSKEFVTKWNIKKYGLVLNWEEES